MEDTQNSSNTVIENQEVQAAAPAPQHKEKNTAKAALILGIIGTAAGTLSLALIFLFGALMLLGHGGGGYGDNDWEDRMEDRMENMRVETRFEGRGGMWK